MKVIPLIFQIAVVTFLIVAGAIVVRAQGDITAPVLVDLKIEPQAVDTKARSQTITMTAHFADDLSGYGDAFIIFAPKMGTTQSIEFPFRETSRISGTTQNGLYQASATLPQYAAEDRWIIRQLSLVDKVGNRKDYFESSSDGMPEYLHQFYFINVEEQPTPKPTEVPTEEPSPEPTEEATPQPTSEVTPEPTPEVPGESGGQHTKFKTYIPSAIN